MVATDHAEYYKLRIYLIFFIPNAFMKNVLKTSKKELHYQMLDINVLKWYKYIILK